MSNKKSLRTTYFIIGFVAFVALLFWIASPSSSNENETFAQCLTESGVKMYGTDWCQYCQQQKSMFGNKAFKLVDYVNCDFNQAECNEAGIQGYPTWIINGETYQGIQSLQTLSSLTGCALE